MPEDSGSNPDPQNERLMMKKAFGMLALCFLVFGGAVAAAQDGDLIPNRLSCAEVGEWASYRLPGGYVQKLTVTGRSGQGDDALVTITVENIYDGKVVDTKEISHEAGPVMTTPSIPNVPGVTVAVRNELAKLKGKDIVAGVVEINKFLGVDDEDNTVTEWWTSCDVPVFGILKKVTDGDAEWELHQFGFAEKKADADAKK